MKSQFCTTCINFSYAVDEDLTGEADYCPDHGGSVYNGSSQVLYWADGFSEIAFIVPTPSPATTISTETRTVPSN